MSALRFVLVLAVVLAVVVSVFWFGAGPTAAWLAVVAFLVVVVGGFLWAFVRLVRR